MEHGQPEKAPRMTPALQEALQQFAGDSRTSHEDAHTAALKEYRQHDRVDYTDHINSLADQERTGDIDSGRTYRNLLLREHIQTDIEDGIDSTLRQAQELGSVALHHSKVISKGIYSVANKKVFEYQANRSYKKHSKEVHKEALQDNKAFDKNLRKQARNEKWTKRREHLAEKTINPARRLGERAVSLSNNVYLLGLEQTDTSAAAAYKDTLANRRAQKRERALETALLDVDMTIQSPQVLELLQDEQFKPIDPVQTNETQGFVSTIFRNEDVSDSHFAVYYDQQTDGQILPILLTKEEGTPWKRANHLLPEELRDLSHAEKTAYEEASKVLNSRTDIKDVDVRDLTRLADSLTFRRSAPKEVVSEFRKKRDEILKARREAEKRVQSRKRQAHSQRNAAQRAQSKAKKAA